MTGRRGRGATAAAALGVAAAAWIAACYDPMAPESCGTVPEQTVTVGEAASIEVCFRDANEEMLAIAVTSADPSVATATAAGSRITVTAVSPGAAAVTATATDPGGLKAQQTFRVVVPNRPPAAVGELPDLELAVGDSAAFDAAAHFAEPDGQPLRYAASASDSGRVAASVQGSTVTVAALAKGGTTVTVTATDPGGLSASQRFEVEAPNRAPVAEGTIAARVIEVDATDTIDAAVFFADPDGDELSYAAEVSDGAVARAAAAGASLLVTALAKGAAEIAVTATDDEGLSASQSFRVTVPNRAPATAGTIEDRVVFKNATDTVDLSAYFADPDGDELAYAAEVSDGAAASASVAGASLLVTGLAKGAAEIAVTATDGDGLSASQSFKVAVPNRAPATAGTIEDRVVFKNATDTVDLSAYFADPDGDELAYAASASDGGVVAVSVAGASLLVAGLAKGAAEVTVTATDDDGLSASQSFGATVPNRAPQAEGTIAARVIEVNATDTIGVAAFFADPDGDELSYAASSSAGDVAAVEVAGASLLVAGLAKGAAEVTVTATDGEGLSASQSFGVTVANRGPEAAGTLPDRVVFKNATDTVNLSAFFADPDGDELSYAAEVSDGAVASVTVAGASLLVTGTGQGETSVTVTAADGDGLSAAQTFKVTVPNRAPAATDAIGPQQLSKRRHELVDMTLHFADPDGDELRFEAVSSDTAVVEAFAMDALIDLHAGDEGEAVVTVTATDPGGLSATQTFAVTVRNRAPTVTAEIPAQRMFATESDTLDATLYFQDPDGDSLAFAPETSNRRIVDVTRKGTGIILWALGAGSADVTVTATDPDGLTASQTFAVTVAVRGPQRQGEIPERILNPGDADTLSAAAYFRHPDGAAMSFEASAADTAVATVSASGANVILTAVAVGETTLTVTATDPEGLSAAQTAQVKVEPEDIDPPNTPSDTAFYSISFNSTWSASTHPTSFPPNPHFSPLVGAVHNGSVTFWRSGATASAGIEQMAETGGTSQLRGEISAHIPGNAKSIVDGSGINSPGGTTIPSVEVTLDHPLITLVTMIAPSPDWFVGVSGLSMLEGGQWANQVVVELFPYDAGSDDGTSYLSADADTSPKQAISSLTGVSPFSTAPMGTFTFTRIAAAGNR